MVCYIHMDRTKFTSTSSFIEKCIQNKVYTYLFLKGNMVQKISKNLETIKKTKVSFA